MNNSIDSIVEKLGNAWRRVPTSVKLTTLGGAMGLIMSACDGVAETPTKAPDTQTPKPTATQTHTPSPTITPSPTPTPTITPTPTPDPNADPDGDGYSNYNETIWGTDPNEFTSFEDLTTHPGTIYAKMRISQPYAIKESENPDIPYEIDVEELNSTIYQVIRPIEVEYNGTPDNPSDDHLTLEIVLFPYATHPREIIESAVDSWPIDPSIYPREILQYLESTEISNITDEMIETLVDVVKDAKTDVEAMEEIFRWNWDNFSVKEEWKGLKYGDIVAVQAGEMFENKQTRWSTTRSTLLAAELRSIGIPTAQIYGVLTTPEMATMAIGHAQELVYLNGVWVRFDYGWGFYSSKEAPSDLSDPQDYAYLVFTDIFRDNSEIDTSRWILQLDINFESPLETKMLDLHEVIDFRQNEY